MPTPLAILSEVFGLDAFRTGQTDIINSVLDGKDTLAIMPTGGGKSLCYQLPAMCLPSVTIVISPLIALMRDQVAALRAMGVPAGALHSANTPEESEAVFEALEAGRLKLLYLAPERLANPASRLLLSKIKPSLLAVDEAHCISEWGHDFRPDYLRIAALRRELDVPMAAFTATADPKTRQDIYTKLFGAEAQEFLFGFDRPNIHLRFAAKSKPRAQVLDFLAQRRDQSGIIYCATRAKCETLAHALRAEGYNAHHYHAGMEAEDRRLAELRFGREDGVVMVATVAFGMGIDKPDIRFVVHADLPKSIESYYQEIGRAGRDGLPADTLTLYGADDIRLRRMQIDEGLGDAARKDFDHGRLNILLGLAEAQGCRRQILLRYFGEASEPCGNCDLCDKPPELFDATKPIQMALSAILRSQERFGAGHIIDILRGVSTQKVTSNNHQSLPTFGVGKDWSKPEWDSVIRQMMGYDLIRPDPTRFGALRLTQAARPILKGDQTLELRKDSFVKAVASKKIKTLISEEDEPLFAALKMKRRELAEAQKVPAYIVFADAVLLEMAKHRPANLDEFAQLSGVGQKKRDRYGDVFLAVINGAAQRTHPARRKLAGRAGADIFDRLQNVAKALEKGEGGFDKPLYCSQSLLRRFAEARPRSADTARQILGDRRMDRFGAAFLEVVAQD
ncbi:MAG: DNA helicase RecQ [Pseudomonadota bacterium]